MSHFAEPVIPDELRFAERDPESSECDEVRYSLLRGEGTCNYPRELSKQSSAILAAKAYLTVAGLRLKKWPGGSASFFPAGRFGEMFSKCMPLIVSQRRLGRGQSSNGHPER